MGCSVQKNKQFCNTEITTQQEIKTVQESQSKYQSPKRNYQPEITIDSRSKRLLQVRQVLLNGQSNGLKKSKTLQILIPETEFDNQ